MRKESHWGGIDRADLDKAIGETTSAGLNSAEVVDRPGRAWMFDEGALTSRLAWILPTPCDSRRRWKHGPAGGHGPSCVVGPPVATRVTAGRPRSHSSRRSKGGCRARGWKALPLPPGRRHHLSKVRAPQDRPTSLTCVRRCSSPRVRRCPRIPVRHRTSWPK